MSKCDRPPADDGRVRRQGLGAALALAALTAAFAPMALAAPAAAATISVAKRCYVNTGSKTGSPITIAGRGFPGSDRIQLAAGGNSGNITASPAGTFDVVVRGPVVPTAGPATQTFTVTATDLTTTGITATTNVTMANLAVATNPATALPTQRISWMFSGFTPGKTIWIHYLHDNKAVARMKFGKAKGPCGTLTAKARFYPGGHPPFKRYKVVFDNSKRYRKGSIPRIVTTLRFDISS